MPLTSLAHDLIVVGAGPAGLTTGIYAARAGLSVAIAEKYMPGGQIALSSVVENYPGTKQITGYELSDAMREHAEAVGCRIMGVEADGLSIEGDGTFDVSLGGTVHHAASVVYAAGATPRRAGFEGEEAFTGRGVSYCATCDGMLYRGKKVFVVGGGQAACEEAEYLSRLANDVTMLVRGDVLKVPRSVMAHMDTVPNLTIRFHTRIKSLSGTAAPSTIVLEDTKTGALEELDFEERSFGVFVFVGFDPNVDLVRPYVELAYGGVVTDGNMRTCTPGLLAAGDVRDTVLRQVLTAASDGAIAAMSAMQYLEQRHL